MKTYSEFLLESERRIGRALSPRGPSSTRGFMARNRTYGEYDNTPPTQQRTQRRAMLRRHGLPKGSANLKTPETKSIKNDGMETKVTTHKNSGHFANERLRTMQMFKSPKKDQHQVVKSITKHLGRNHRKPFSDVDIYNTNKNDSKMTSGRKFMKAVKNVPKDVRSAGGKSFGGVPTDMNTGRHSPSREKLYRDKLKMTRQDKTTRYQFKRG